MVAALPALYSLDLRGKSLAASHLEPLAVAMLENVSRLRLTSADVSENSLGDAGAGRIASAVCAVAGISRLDASWNRIGAHGAAALASSLTTPGCGVAVLRLECNDLGDAGAAAIAEALPRCPTLRALDVAANRIGSAGGIRLASALPRCNLERLELGRNFLGPRGASALADALLLQANSPSHGLGRLQSLGLSVNRIRDGGALAAAAALSSGQAGDQGQPSSRPIVLEALDLGGNQITDHGAGALARSLRRGEAPLRWLGLGRNKLSAVTSTAFAEAMSAGLNPSLHTVVLVGNDEIGEAASAEVTHALRRNSWSLALYDPLRSAVDACRAGAYAVDLSSVTVGPGGAEPLAAALRGKQTRVCQLVLRSCMLRDAGFSKLAAALAGRAPWLSHLDLGWNRLGPASSVCLAELLRSPGASALELLDLECNDVADDGVAALVGASAAHACTACDEHPAGLLRPCSRLRVLRLSGNRISGSGVLGLAGALSLGMASVEELDLGRNPLGNAGGAALGEGLARPRGALRKLLLAVVRLGDQGIQALAKGLRSRGLGGGQSVHLNLNGNRIGDEGITAFAEALAQGAAVKAVTLEHNKITGKGLERLAAGLRCRFKGGQAWSQVAFVSFNGNPLSSGDESLLKQVSLCPEPEEEGATPAKRPRLD